MSSTTPASQGPSPNFQNLQAVAGQSREINFHALKMGRIKLETVKDVANYIKINPEMFIPEHQRPAVAAFQERIEHKIAKIKAETTGFLGFLRSIFAREATKQKLEFAEQLKNLSENLAKRVKEGAPKHAEPPKVEKAAVKQQVEQPPVEPRAEEIIREEAHIEAPVAQEAAPPRPAPPPPPPFARAAKPPPTEPAAEGEAQPAASAAPPPPAPPKGPPKGPPVPPSVAGKGSPTPLASAPKKVESREVRQMKERAEVSKNFYIEKPPSNARELEKTKTRLEKDIGDWKRLTQGLSGPQKEEATTKIADMEKELAGTKEQLQGTKKPVSQSGPELMVFKEKLRKYPNDEIKAMIALYFDGKAPDASHPSYDYYNLNKPLIDGILADWKDKIQTTEKGEAYKAKAEEWKRYIQNSSLTGFIEFMKARVKGTEQEPQTQQAKAEPTTTAQRPAQTAKKPVSTLSPQEEITQRFEQRKAAEQAKAKGNETKIP